MFKQEQTSSKINTVVEELNKLARQQLVMNITGRNTWGRKMLDWVKLRRNY